MKIKFPTLLRSNAYTGTGAAEGLLTPGAAVWALHHAPPQRHDEMGLVPKEIDLHDWTDSRVGWGVVAAAPSGLPDSDLAKNADLPESVRDLIRKRNNAPVFRYRKGWEYEFDKLTNYADDLDVGIAGSEFGAKTGLLPKYLLILGGAQEVPWEVQFQLNSTRFVGRLPITGADLDNYIAHLNCNWNCSRIQLTHPVVWATDFGYPDITELMRAVVAKPVYQEYANNPKIGAGATLIEGVEASRKKLADALLAQRPGVVVTTSHGMIGPQDDPKKAAAQLGALVDQNRQLLDPDALVNGWQPDGAVWYAHACCSAGTQGSGRLKGLVAADSDLGQALQTLSKIGPAVAPLPLKLLSAKHPARAFIGHVEPTFDVTLRDAETGQLFTSPIKRTLYNDLLQPNPVGYSMQTLLGPLASINSRYISVQQSYQDTETERARLLNYALRGLDLGATVLLGDPTAMLPAVD